MKQVYGPTFEEMLHPERTPDHIRQGALAAAGSDPQDPINLFNINWRDRQGKVRQLIFPPELSGVEAPIMVLLGRGFPTGSHKVGATYSVTIEKQVAHEIAPGVDTLIFPSTGNYGIGGSWVGTRMGYRSVVVLPEDMSRERFEKIRQYGAEIIKTPGCESNVKEIYDCCKDLAAASGHNKVMNQFEVMANYRFHWYVTGNSALEAVEDLESQGIGNGRAAAFVSAMGSAGTIAAGDRLKQHSPSCKIVGLEPIECPTLYRNGYGSHDIQGIGDKHVTWIHNVKNLDALMCVSDTSCKLGLQVIADQAGREYLARELKIPGELLDQMADAFGISGVCNVLGAIKTAKFFGFGKKDLVVTVATDGLDRYHSVLDALSDRVGALSQSGAEARVKSIFHGIGVDWIAEGTMDNRERWHNLKYFTWVEQQGKTVAELDAQRDPQWWLEHQRRVPEIDTLIRQQRGF